jgi:hypothetical protein
LSLPYIGVKTADNLKFFLLPWHYYVQSDDEIPAKRQRLDDELEKKLVQKIDKMEKKLEKIEEIIGVQEQPYDVNPFLGEPLFPEKDTFFETPSYKAFLSSYERMVDTYPVIHTLVVIGPKGCGKTTSEKQLHLKLLQTPEAKKVSAYIDLAKIKKEDITTILQKLKSNGVEVLLLDNVQAMDEYHGIDGFKYVIGAFSPGAKNTTLISKFTKVRDDGRFDIVSFCPLNAEDSKQVFQKQGFTIGEEPKPEPKYLTYKEFMGHVHYTGGVPRYLNWIAQFGEEIAYRMMGDEIENQLIQIRQNHSLENVCHMIKTFVLNQSVSAVDDVVTNGIGYIDSDRQGRIVSPRYIHIVLDHEQLLLSSRTSWRELELLTLFRLKFQNNITVENNLGERIRIPKPTLDFVQREIGDMPKIEKHDVCLMALAPSHPVIDAVLLDWQSSELTVFYIQTSFSKYEKHNKKRTDMQTTKLSNKRNAPTVEQFFNEKIKKLAKETKTYFIYATTEFNHKWHDDEVYFMDLRNTMF